VKFRVYIVDRHALIRRGLVEVINAQVDMEVCGEAEEGTKAFNAIMALRPDVVTVEISLEGNSGIELIKSIRHFDPKIGILVVSMCDEFIYASRALRAGAGGFVSKGDKSEGVVNALRRIHGGHLCFSAAVENQMLSAFARGDRNQESAVSCLSDRELEIGSHIGRGLNTREIAEHLGLSVKTIETHRANIKEKLGLPTGTLLLRFWLNWVDEVGSNGQKPMRERNSAESGTDGHAPLRPARRSSANGAADRDNAGSWRRNGGSPMSA
jgi:DNA-binding NarL/FixJ family response regulator